MSNPDAGRSAAPLSVVVAAWTGPHSLARCIDSLLGALDPADEIVVAANFDDALPTRGQAPRIVQLPVEAVATVPQLRAAGLCSTTGEVVAFLEDHCVVTPGWRTALLDEHGPAIAGVGGPVDLAAGGRPLDWAVYFQDYARFTPPMADQSAPSLSGANMSFDRAFLESMLEKLREGVLETDLEAECACRGLQQRIAAGAVVVHGARHQARRSLSLAFHQARGYAGRRRAHEGAARRVLLLAGAPLLPLVLGFRIVGEVWRRGRNGGRLAGASGWLALILLAWAAGEAAGYLAGAGGSDKHWR